MKKRTEDTERYLRLVDALAQLAAQDPSDRIDDHEQMVDEILNAIFILRESGAGV